MQKHTIEFTFDDNMDSDELNYQKKDLEMMMNAANAHRALNAIADDIFRPHRKHGYSNENIQELIDKNDEASTVIGLLEEHFYDVLKDYNIDLEDV